MAVGKSLNFPEKRLQSLVACALLHDICSPPPYKVIGESVPSQECLQEHCRIGQSMLDLLPLPTPIDGFILYHHELADGSGAFGMSAEQVPFEASLICLCGFLDMTVDFDKIGPTGLPTLRKTLQYGDFDRFNPHAIKALLKVLDGKLLHLLRSDLTYLFWEAFPPCNLHLNNNALYKLGAFVAHLVGAQSEYTREHSLQVANIYWLLGRERGYDKNLLAELYLVGCMHDCGKLSLSGRLLDKKSRLDTVEMQIIETHAHLSQIVLRSIAGASPLCEWASNHHERLDGSGYPNGLRARELDEPSQLLAVCDVYEATGASRPYHPRRSPRQIRSIIGKMSDAGKLNPEMVAQACGVLGHYRPGHVPAPSTIEQTTVLL
jgi:HD-GYP domain-containing protein (c-di-GMP phosphodiesterase class II)